MDVSLPALAHRVTVFGSTRNIVATSAGVSSGSASGVRAAILRPLLLDRNLRSLRSFLAWSSLTEPVVVSHMLYRDHIAITTGNKSTTRRKVFYLIVLRPVQSLSLSVSVAILRVASWQIRKYCDRGCQISGPADAAIPHETVIAASPVSL